MEIERAFRKTALYFIILASRNKQVLSALEFFDKNFNLDDIDRDFQDEYRDFWGSILIDNINLLPQEKRKLISISFVEPQSSGTGFRFPADVLRYDIIALKSNSSKLN